MCVSAIVNFQINFEIKSRCYRLKKLVYSHFPWISNLIFAEKVSKARIHEREFIIITTSKTEKNEGINYIRIESKRTRIFLLK